MSKTKDDVGPQYNVATIEDRKKNTICWGCKRSVGKEKCCWADTFKPVKGWVAVRNDLKSTPKGGLVISYIVLECPLFCADDLVPQQQKYKKYCGKGK